MSKSQEQVNSKEKKIKEFYEKRPSLLENRLMTNKNSMHQMKEVKAYQKLLSMKNLYPKRERWFWKDNKLT